MPPTQAGNRAAQRLLASGSFTGQVTVMRQYKAKPKDKNELKRAVEDKWGKAIQRAGDTVESVVDDLIEWCTSHRQALLLVSKLTYDKFIPTGDPNALEDELIGIKQEPEVPVTVDPMTRAMQAIKQSNRSADFFTQDEIDTIVTLGQQPDIGWNKAVTQVADMKQKQKQDADLVADRVAKYAATKVEGDTTFGGLGLVFDVWNVAYGVATAASANKNTELGASASDDDIVDAAAIWHHHADVGQVSKFHVPGYPSRPIQDKSKRKKNPDKTRGRQADFIASWGGGAINVHVNSTVVH